MRIEIEDWVSTLKISSTAENLLRESIVCYKASAYRASLLFSYVGFQTILKDRMLAAKCPTGISVGQWESIIRNLTDDDKWDGQVYDAVQMKSPASIFGISDDLRNQLVFWKNRRNDCAHSKQNEIGFSHVETFWLFLKSNLAKLVVSGSKEGLLINIRKHFDYSMTPRGADSTYIVEQIPSAISTNELPSFFENIYSIFYPSDNAFVVTKEEIDFWNRILSQNMPTITGKLIGFLKTKLRLTVEILREHPERIHLFSDDTTFIRKLWYSILLQDQDPNDIKVYCSLLRNQLIPDNQIAEAHTKILSRLYGVQLSEDSFEILKSTGFFDIFRQKAFLDRSISNFDWANRNSTTIVFYLGKFPIDDEVGSAIQKTFDVENHPWTLKNDLVHFFQENEGKKKEFEEALTRLDLKPPAYLRVLDSQKVTHEDGTIGGLDASQDDGELPF